MTCSSCKKNPITLDVLGMNFYPQWSTKQIYLDKSGQIAFRRGQSPMAKAFPN
jgi:hypothetical protein